MSATARTTRDRRVAVIDIGSNSGRLIVYSLERGGQLHILAGSRVPLRLARGLEASGRIQRVALDRTCEALRDFHSIARGSGAGRVVVAGTSALRDAANGPAFIRRVRNELKLEIRILSGVEEAHYGFLGAVTGLPVDDGMAFDLGGGSLQLATFRARALVQAMSLPLGALRVSEAFLRSDPPAGSEVHRLREHARRLLEAAGLRPLAPGEQVIGTGGSVRNLARVDEREASYPIAGLHGYVLSAERVHALAGSLARMRLKRRTRVPGLNEDRGDSIAGGAIVIDTLLGVLQAGEVLVSGHGVREGLARSLVADEVAPADVVRERSTAALARRFAGWSAERARCRTAIAGALLQALDPAASREAGETLRHAAFLLDIGSTVHFFDRYGHVADLVLATDLAGFSHRQLALLSAVLRQAGDEGAPQRPLELLVRPGDHRGVRRSAVLLALADEIAQRSAPRSLPAVACRRTAELVSVRVAGLGSWSGRRIDERFAAAFGRRLRVLPG